MISDISTTGTGRAGAPRGDDGEQYFLDLLHKELVTAMGCTEPAAAALAGAAARKALGCAPEKVTIRASRDIIKNALNVSIPNSAMKGIGAAAALGAAIGDTDAGLNILSFLTREQEAEAARLLNEGRVTLCLAENAPPVFIEARLGSGGRTITARVQHEHNKVEIFDGERKIKTETEPGGAARTARMLTPARIFAFADHVDATKIDFLVSDAEVNLDLAEEAVKTGYGINVGKTTFRTDDYFAMGASLAAGASDARMAGCTHPVVINSGSGNQGITVSVPVLVLARGMKRNREETARALCLSHLVALMMTARKDRLSALCGAFTAATGTGAGFVRVLGGDNAAVLLCVRNIIANLMGVICDGAKGSCALKIYTCVEAAALGAKLAMAGHGVPESEGILGLTMGDTLGNVEHLSHEGMISLDKTILNIMIDKGNKKERSEAYEQN